MYVSGEVVGRVIVDTLIKLGIFKNVKGVVFDTCAANTGWKKGK